MPPIFIIITIIAVCLPLIVIFAFIIPNYRSIIKRARKIDPSVKTIAEAQYVLQKDVMKSMGQKNETDKADKNEGDDRKN